MLMVFKIYSSHSLTQPLTVVVTTDASWLSLTVTINYTKIMSAELRLTRQKEAAARRQDEEVERQIKLSQEWEDERREVREQMRIDKEEREALVRQHESLQRSLLEEQQAVNSERERAQQQARLAAEEVKTLTERLEKTESDLLSLQRRMYKSVALCGLLFFGLVAMAWAPAILTMSATLSAYANALSLPWQAWAVVAAVAAFVLWRLWPYIRAVLSFLWSVFGSFGAGGVAFILVYVALCFLYVYHRATCGVLVFAVECVAGTSVVLIVVWVEKRAKGMLGKVTQPFKRMANMVGSGGGSGGGSDGEGVGKKVKRA